MLDDMDEVHLDAGLLKPAGLTSGKTVGQSGVSKAFDEREGNDLLSEVAQTLAEAETQAARMALRVLGVAEGPAGGDDQVVVEYPREYDLFTANDLAVVLGDIQLIASSLGTLPQTEGEVLARLVKVLLPGISDERLAELQAEVKAAAVQGGADRDAAREGRQTSSSATGNDNLGVEDQNAGEAPGGTTQNATEDPSITLPPDAAMAVQALNAIIAPELV